MLDRADEAAGALDWERVRVLCEGVLRLDPENEDALVYLAAANRRGQEVARAMAAAKPAPAPGDPAAPGIVPARAGA